MLTEMRFNTVLLGHRRRVDRGELLVAHSGVRVSHGSSIFVLLSVV